jgi:hypothetical protein
MRFGVPRLTPRVVVDKRGRDKGRNEKEQGGDARNDDEGDNTHWTVAGSAWKQEVTSQRQTRHKAGQSP